ncbi:MAG: metal ABC transporter substrate-binding protein [Candidatus Jordarchaeum sp.]|uniref:metal ABC transporter substrate-binding protein n=1 Tax=Candidatus Jordarchaeum sp. TaxID=2823881 RepID=UPI00404B0395
MKKEEGIEMFKNITKILPRWNILSFTKGRGKMMYQFVIRCYMLHPRNFLRGLLSFLISLNTYTTVFAKIKVVTTTEDLKSLVEYIGGDKVSVVSLSKGTQDIHQIEPRPSMVIKLRDANMLVKIGMDLDMWVNSLVEAARNSNLFYGEKGYCDASVGIEKLEVPEGKIDASMGDIHIYGNPHYLLSPENAKIAIRNILNTLIKISPEDREYFEKNREDFLLKLDKKISEWKERISKYKGTKIITYHNSWPYFAREFGFQIVGFVEPKPGIPPSPSHIAKLIETIKQENAKLLFVESYFSLRAPNLICQKTGVKVLVLPSQTGGVKEVDNYFKLFDYIIEKIVEALQK